MDDNERDRLLETLIARPHDREELLRSASIDPEDRAMLTDLASTADAVWLSAHGAPHLEDDPVAAMLGLIPDAACQLDSAALSRARKRNRLTVSELAGKLRQRGWDATTSDVFRWETRAAPDVPPAVVQAIADILGASADDLTARSPADHVRNYLSAIRDHPRFGELTTRWAQIRHVSTAVAASTLEGRLLATVHRGEQPDVDQMLQSLDALVSSLESARREQR